MTFTWQRGKPIRRTGRVLKSELLQTADLVLADRNLCDIARINSWFGGHRALLRVLKELAPRQKQFSLLDVGAGSGDMGKCIRQHFQNAMVASLDHHTFHLRRMPGPRLAADVFQLSFLIELIAELRRFASHSLIVLDLTFPFECSPTVRSPNVSGFWEQEPLILEPVLRPARG